MNTSLLKIIRLRLPFNKTELVELECFLKPNVTMIFNPIGMCIVIKNMKDRNIKNIEGCLATPTIAIYDYYLN